MIIIRVRRMGGAAGSFSFYSHLGRFSYILQLSVYVGEENEEKDTQHIRWIREWGVVQNKGILGGCVEEELYDESLKVHTIPLFRLGGMGPVFSCAASLVYTHGGTKKSRELYRQRRTKRQ